MSDDRRRAGAEPHLAATAGADRHRWAPAPEDAGNVLLPYTTAKLSLRLPPTLDAETAGTTLQTAVRGRPALRRRGVVRCRRPPRPAGTRRRWRPGSARRWRAPREAAFGAPPAYMGEGGTIPFMAMLGEKFPAAQFVVTGVLGPALQRPRPQRIPAPADRPPDHPSHRPSARRPPHPPAGLNARAATRRCLPSRPPAAIV